MRPMLMDNTDPNDSLFENTLKMVKDLVATIDWGIKNMLRVELE